MTSTYTKIMPSQAHIEDLEGVIMGGRNHCMVIPIWYLFSSYRDTNLAK